MLKELCGPEALHNVIFVSTKWDEFRKGDLEDRTPMEARNDDTYWDGGSRFTTTRESLLKRS
jgi:hypothetical protein